MSTPLTKQEQIVEAVVAALKLIRKDALVPNMPPESDLRYRITPKTVTRALADLPSDKHPALFVTDPQIQERHLLADVSECTMNLFISGALYDYNDESVRLLNVLRGDVRTCVVSNSTWSGLARRTRVIRSDGNTEIEEPNASFTMALEIDYLEYPDVPRTYHLQEPLPVEQTGMSRFEQILNTYNNVLLNLPEISFVRRAEVWPIPMEQIPRNQCPAVFFSPQNYTMDYRVSQQSMKQFSIANILVDVEFDFAAFLSSSERWAAQFVILMGKYNDLNGRVLTIDVQSVRTNRSVYPLVIVDADILVKFYESFLIS